MVTALASDLVISPLATPRFITSSVNLPYPEASYNPFAVRHSFVKNYYDASHFGTNTSKGRLSYFWVHFTAQLDVLSHKKETNAENILFPEYGFFSINGLTTVLFNQLSDISFEDDKRSKLMCGYALNMLLLEISKENNSHKDNNSNDIPIVITSAMDWIYRNRK